MAEQNGNKNGTAFISYSRRDKVFVQKLEAALEGAGVNTWVDWQGIPLSADWMAEIKAAIESSDAFIFVISPDSLSSKVCGDELELGLNYNKKLVPILHREPEKDQNMHTKVAATNWVYLREEDNFDETIPRLVETINTDLEWVRQHTRLLRRAVEWESKNRNSSFLLNGTDLTDAENWLSQASAQIREIVPIQSEYILASRQRASRNQRITLVAVSLALVISLFLAVAAVFQSIRAIENADLAANNAATAVANEQLAKQNEGLAKDNAATAMVSEQLAKNNAATAVANENARATQQAIAIANEALAKANEQLAKDNEQQVIGQRGASQANLVRQQPSQLYASTLLALYSLGIAPSETGQEVLRQNLSLMAVPVASFSQASNISSANFSPDGNSIVSTGRGFSAYVWDANTGEQLAELPHDGVVNIGLFSPDGKWIVTGSDDGLARVWNASDFSLVTAYAPPDNPPENLKRVADIDISPDSQYIAVGRDNGLVTTIELATGKLKLRMPNTGKIHDVVFSPDGQRLAVATDAGTATIWNPYTGTSYITAQHLGDVYQVAFSPDSHYAVTASQDQTSQVLLINSSRKIQELVHDEWVESVAFNPTGTDFATASDDYNVRVWDAENYRERLRMRHAGFAQYVTYDPYGWWLASSSQDGTARIWDPVSGQEMIRIPLYGAGGPVKFSPDGLMLLTTNEFGELRTWDISQLDSMLVSIETSELVRGVSFSPDDRYLASAGDDGVVELWDVNAVIAYVSDGTSDGENLSRVVYKLESGFVRNLLFNPGQPVFNVIGDNIMASVSLDNIGDVKQYIYEDTHFERGEYQFNGNLIAIANGDDGTVSLVDPTTGEVIKQLTQIGGAYAPGFDPLNDNILVVGGQGYLTIWDISTDAILKQIEHPGKKLDVVFSHNGQWLATGGTEGNIDLWRVIRDGGAIDLQLEYEMNRPGITNDIEFNSEDTLIATAGEGGLVQIWDVETGEELSRLQHPQSVRRISFSHDGQYLASSSGKLIFIWDIKAIPTFKTEDLVSDTCARLPRNLTQEEWFSLGLSGERQAICPNLP